MDQNTTSPSPALRLAQRITAQLAALPQVDAVALGGSQASGQVDAASDIDLYVFTRAAVPLPAREDLLARSGGARRASLGLTYWGPGDEWIDAATGIEVDLVYFDAAWIEDQLDRVLVHHQPSLGYTTAFWHTLHSARALWDRDGWLGRVQSRAASDYPEPLRTNIIQYNHPVLRAIIPSYHTQVKKAVARQDWVSTNHRLAALFASYFDILFAYNRVLHPGEKRQAAYAQQHCRQLPANFLDDLQAVLAAAAGPGPALVERLDALLDHLDQLLAGDAR